MIFKEATAKKGFETIGKFFGNDTPCGVVFVMLYTVAYLILCAILDLGFGIDILSLRYWGPGAAILSKLQNNSNKEDNLSKFFIVK